MTALQGWLRTTALQCFRILQQSTNSISFRTRGKLVCESGKGIDEVNTSFASRDGRLFAQFRAVEDNVEDNCSTMFLKRLFGTWELAFLNILAELSYRL